MTHQPAPCSWIIREVSDTITTVAKHSLYFTGSKPKPNPSKDNLRVAKKTRSENMSLPIQLVDIGDQPMVVSS